METVNLNLKLYKIHDHSLKIDVVTKLLLLIQYRQYLSCKRKKKNKRSDDILLVIEEDKVARLSK